ncbi:hypothetical protein WUBG_10625 [Wuchereria bancrofti]|nr:hypothetical protein WUBG_10625 [Wuchereria bancrofti]
MRRSTLSYLTSGTAQQTPYIFASYGSLVREKADPFHLLPSNDLSMNHQQRQHYFDPLQKIIEAENVNFENGYSLKVVTENLLDRFEATLSQEYTLPRARSHIPDWAMIVFIICALLCLLMTVGLCLMQTSVRRGSPRGKPADTTRRWKAGFVGGMWYDVYRDKLIIL